MALTVSYVALTVSYVALTVLHVALTVLYVALIVCAALTVLYSQACTTFGLLLGQDGEVKEKRVAKFQTLEQAVDYDLFIKSQLASTRLTLRSHLLQCWSRYLRIFGGLKPC